jgi:hypothetical protein
MTVSILKSAILCLALFVWGCATSGLPRGFSFIPVTEQTYPETQEARFYEQDLDQPHQIIGEVTLIGKPKESQQSLERRLLESARRVGAQGVIVLETGQMDFQVGVTGIRHDRFGGAAKRYQPYPDPLPIEEKRTYIQGIAIRFDGG